MANEINIEKCKVISFHHRRYSNNGVIPNYTMNSKLLTYWYFSENFHNFYLQYIRIFICFVRYQKEKLQFLAIKIHQNIC